MNKMCMKIAKTGFRNIDSEDIKKDLKIYRDKKRFRSTERNG